MASAPARAKLSYLNLIGSGLSLLERLTLEEALLRHDPLKRCWAIAGSHDPIHGSRIRIIDDNIANSSPRYQSCAIVLGLGGKPEQLVNLNETKRDNVLMIKRFSGGGTVVVDHDSLLTTFIGRTDALPDVQPYPREIMQWSSDAIFGPVFESLKADVLKNGSSDACGDFPKKKTLVMHGKSCGLNDYRQLTTSNNAAPIHVPDFELRENDYVLGVKKMGGNAQSIVKGGWLHHTSFLWDYVDDHMQYLTLPNKRPDYRGDRSHDDFLVKLKSYYGSLDNGKKIFFDRFKEATENTFHVEEVSLKEVIGLVDEELGGMQTWFDGKCRTRIIEHG
mmetsp:Transcript_17579/g.27383  ORF Transcript_17579/g.27383 Transcript_17579/m.27383 type:complete len:334 (+) Transcript_17579:212-1213(+)